MIGGGPSGREVLRLVEDWIPEKAYRSEVKYSNDLQDWLDRELNSGGMGMGGRDVVVSREHGQANADVAVDGEIGIELKYNFKNTQADRLAGQIDRYIEYYPTVIVVACGLKDTDRWRKLKNRWEGQGFGAQADVFFVHKRKDNFGGSRSGGGAGLF